jgi:hypothetical protein
LGQLHFKVIRIRRWDSTLEEHDVACHAECLSAAGAAQSDDFAVIRDHALELRSWPSIANVPPLMSEVSINGV